MHLVVDTSRLIANGMRSGGEVAHSLVWFTRLSSTLLAILIASWPPIKALYPLSRYIVITNREAS